MQIEPAPLARPNFETLVSGGFFGKYLAWTVEHESPAQFHFGAVVTAIASGLGRRPLIDWEARALYPNLFTLLVGPTGARKGAAMERAVKLTVGSMGAHCLPNEGTHQGFAAALKKRYAVTQDASDGIIVAPEFSVLLSKDMNKADLVKWLTDWYDSPSYWERALRGEEEYELRNLCVSVLGGSNVEWLKTMPSDAITGGFMPRFILFDAPDKRHWKARPTFNKALEQEMQIHLAQVALEVPEHIKFDTEAGKYLDHWYEHELRAVYESNVDEQYRAWLARKQAAAMKLACVWQLADRGPRDAIMKEWLEKARRVVDWGDTAVEEVYGALGVTSEGQVAQDVMVALVAHGGVCGKRRLRKLLRRRYTSARVDAAVQTLQATGEVDLKSDLGEGSLVRVR